MRFIALIRGCARSVGIAVPLPAKRPDVRSPAMQGAHAGRAFNKMNRPSPQTIVVAAVALSALLSACTHEPMVSPGETITDDGGGGTDPEPEDTCDQTIAYFEQDVLPIFVQNCTMSGCHNTPTDDNEEVVLTSYAGIRNNGYWDDIWDEIGDGNMPPDSMNQLTPEDLATLQTWLNQGAQNNSCEGGCSMNAVTYAGTILPIIQDRCDGCHGPNNPQGGLDFSSWNDLNTVAGDGRLALAIQHQTGAEPMPPSGPSLSQCRIDQVLAWIQDGAPNN